MAILNKIKILKIGVYLLVQTPLKLQFSKNHKYTLQYQTGSNPQALFSYVLAALYAQCTQPRRACQPYFNLPLKQRDKHWC
jgi:hypothetical protein